MEASLDVLPSPYGLKLDSVDSFGAMTLFTWGGSYVNSDVTYFVNIHKLDLNLREVEVVDDQGNNLSDWQMSAAMGTSPRFSIEGLPKTERSGKMSVRYVFRVKAVVGLNGKTLEEAEDLGLEISESEPAVLYSTLYGTYDNLISVEEGNPAIFSQHSLPREDLTWVVDGEPLSGAIGSVTEDSLFETSRIVGDSVSDNISYELRDGTLNRLPKELYVNDMYLNDLMDKVVGGLEVSKNNASLDASSGIMAETVVSPNLELNVDKQFNSKGPSVRTNSNQVLVSTASVENGVYGLAISTGLERNFTIVNLLKSNNVFREGHSYYVDINFSLNAVQDSSTTPSNLTEKVRTTFRFTGLRGGDKTITVDNVYSSWLSVDGTRSSGYMYNHFGTDNTSCYAIIEPMLTRSAGGTLNRPSVNCVVSCTDLDGNPTSVGIYSLNIRVTELF